MCLQLIIPWPNHWIADCRSFTYMWREREVLVLQILKYTLVFWRCHVRGLCQRIWRANVHRCQGVPSIGKSWRLKWNLPSIIWWLGKMQVVQTSQVMNIRPLSSKFPIRCCIESLYFIHYRNFNLLIFISNLFI